MEAKTPYEIRLDMIKEAKDFLTSQYHMNFEAARMQWDQNVRLANDAQSIMKFDAPKYPTFEEMMAMATKMNDFVSNVAKTSMGITK